MVFQAPQSRGVDNSFAALLLQMGQQASAQANQSIENIGARLLSLSEARKDREFALQRDETGREFQREMVGRSEQFTDKRTLAEQSFIQSRDAEARAFSLILEDKRHAMGLEDIETRAQLQVEAERAQSAAEAEAQHAQAQRIAAVQRQVPHLIARAEVPRYMLSARFAKAGTGPEAFPKLVDQLVGEGFPKAVATDIAHNLLLPARMEWVDREQYAAAMSALTVSGDPNADRTLSSIVGDIPFSEADARMAVERHIDEVIGGRLQSISMSRTGALDAPLGTQAGVPRVQSVGVALGQAGITPASIGGEAERIYRERFGVSDTWDIPNAFGAPEFHPDNIVFDNGKFAPRPGLDPSTLARLKPGTEAYRFWQEVARSVPGELFGRQSQTSVPVTPTSGLKQAPGAGTEFTAPAANTPAPSSGLSPEFLFNQELGGLGQNPFMQQFGGPILPNE